MTGTNIDRMSNAEYEITFEPIQDIEDRWEITGEEAEVFLEKAGYFNTERYLNVAKYFDPTPPDRHD